MGFTASLDMGSEKMVMALASSERAACRLVGIKVLASQGMERGVIKDEDKVKACIRSLMNELVKDREIEVLNVALGGEVLRVSERRVTVPLQKRIVEAGDIHRAEQRCREGMGGGQDELVDVIPVAYSVDRGELMAEPLGKSGRSLEVTYQVYLAEYGYLSRMRRLFEDCGVGNVCFCPVVRAYMKALDLSVLTNDFALLDLGAGGVNVVLFREGMLEYEAHLPLGMHTVDLDIMAAFGTNAGQARKLKHEYGQALRSQCKNKKVQIPDTKFTLESRDLSMVVQSRAEELLEGAVYLLQSWGFDRPEDEILITGGGCRLQDLDSLLHRRSGHPVVRAVARGVQTSREEVLYTPEYLVALGLLGCDSGETGETRNGLGEKVVKGLKGFFGI